MNFWDQRFAEPGYKYGTEPNAFLREQATRFAPHSQILVPGDGEGRNGVWLAQQGHSVTSVDSSAVGLQRHGNWRLAAEWRLPPSVLIWSIGRPLLGGWTPWC